MFIYVTRLATLFLLSPWNHLVLHRVISSPWCDLVCLFVSSSATQCGGTGLPLYATFWSVILSSLTIGALLFSIAILYSLLLCHGCLPVSSNWSPLRVEFTFESPHGSVSVSWSHQEHVVFSRSTLLTNTVLSNDIIIRNIFYGQGIVLRNIAPV